MYIQLSHCETWDIWWEESWWYPVKGLATMVVVLSYMKLLIWRDVRLAYYPQASTKRSSGEKRQFIDWILQVKCDVGCTKLTFSDHVSLYRRGMNRRGSTRGNDMGATAWINRWMHKLCVRGLLPFLAPLYLLTVVYAPNVVTNPPSHFLLCSGITLLTLSLLGYWQLPWGGTLSRTSISVHWALKTRGLENVFVPLELIEH